MLSEELPFRQHYIAYKEAFPQDSDLITVVVEAATPDRADVAALALAARLRFFLSRDQGVSSPKP